MSFLTPAFLAFMVIVQNAPASSAPRIRIEFSPEQDAFAAAAREYRDIWAADGATMIAALEAASGLRFEESAIRAVIIEGPSYSGFHDNPMRLRASYPSPTKRATLMHELGHRLQDRFFGMGDEDHSHLFLYLYDAWVRAFGQAFADEQVTVESSRRGLVDYEGIWKTTLARSAEQRAMIWREFLRSRAK